ncbi:polyhomeotic-like protein 3 isoform X2 [Protopterus annectens]|uniref:polyhomeotic-like protein 3 isoform X2 n=1 Tax=Protopterus annectens TaxID=7888 RepID=UPI001CFAE648|nr:polyhomeotic-like protein 3 isoform X2 [Protopterus annectens]
MENEQTPATSSAVTTSNTPSRSQAPQISVYSGTDRQAVQVIQQALHRPANSAAQYLQQMYAAQQQHLMLQTAALQQQHLSSTQLQSLAAVQQANLSGRQSSSPTGNVNQQSSVSQTSINLSTSPAAQLISRSQTSSTSTSTITQQTMLLGGTSPTLTASQAQMYLRAQMLIFTPATVAAVQSDMPVVTSSCSSSSSSSASSSSAQSVGAQVQNLTLRTQPSSTLSVSPTVSLKNTSQAHVLAVSHSKASGTSSKESAPENNKKAESSNPEPRNTAVTRAPSSHQLIAPAPYPSIQPHPLIKHQQISLHQPSQKGPHHQLVIQQQIQHRQTQPQQLQTVTLQNPSQEPPMSQHCLTVQTQGQPPAPNSSPLHQCPSPVTSAQTQPTQQTVVVSPQISHSPSQSPSIIVQPQALLQSQQHTLVLPSHQVESHQPQLHRSNGSPVQLTQQAAMPSHLPPPPSPVAHVGPIQQSNLVSTGQQTVSPPQLHPPSQTPASLSPPVQLSSTPPSQIQPLPLQSVQALSIQSSEMLPMGHVLAENTLLSKEELPAAETLIQMPYQTLPPPQTVAVNLQVQPSTPVEPPLVYQVEEVCEEMRAGQEDITEPRTPTPPTLSPSAIPIINNEEFTSEDIISGEAGPLPLTMTSSASASVIKSSADPSHASIPQPPLLLPANTTRSNSISVPASLPSAESNPPQAIVKPHILTHVIEGFVIQEGLEPFPVSRSSLLVDPPVKGRSQCEAGLMIRRYIESANDLQNSTEHPENSPDTLMDNTTDEGMQETEPGLLECEFCRKIGYARKFLRSKRFCSMSCAKRYNVSCSKRAGGFKPDKGSRWNRKSESQRLGHRGRRLSGIDGSQRDHFTKQISGTYSSVEEGSAAHSQLLGEDSVPAGMVTRLQRQSEREREREMQELRIREVTENTEILQVVQSDPTLWTVDEVWAFIHSLPGCQDIADEFKAQEIDGQALLLLKEDHLMSAMNIKLGPALKICARINSLKET